MSIVPFRGAYLRDVDLRSAKEGKAFVRMHFAADFADTTQEAMGWAPLPNFVDGTGLDGELHGHSLVFTPADIALAHKEVQIECSQVNDFKLHRIQDPKSKGATVTELRFTLRSNQRGACALAEAWKWDIGGARGVLKIHCVEQTEIPGVDDGSDPDDSPQMRLGETEEPGGQFVQGVDFASGPDETRISVITEKGEVIFSGSKDEFDEAVQAAPLATAREAAGGTHAKGRRARKAATQDLPSAPGDGEGEGDGVQRAIPGKGEGWHANITVVERDGVLGWTVAVTILAGPEVEAANTDAPPLSIPAAVQEAAEYAAEWAGYQMDKADKEFKFAAAQIRSWALNAKADNRTATSVVGGAR